MAFHCKRKFETKSEIIPDTAQMLIVEKLTQIPNNNLLYPDKEETRRILSMDERNIEPVEHTPEEFEKSYKIMQETLEQQGLGAFASNYTFEEHVKRILLLLQLVPKTEHFIICLITFGKANLSYNS